MAEGATATPTPAATAPFSFLRMVLPFPTSSSGRTHLRVFTALVRQSRAICPYSFSLDITNSPLGACTLTNVWFRDVCEDAISLLGRGDALIVGGGAQEASDKVIQHNHSGRVTIRDFTVVNAGKLYRSCGDCTDNSSKSPRNVVVQNVRAFGMTSDLVGINSNFGDTASVTGSCGSTKKVCQEYRGVNKGNGSSSKVDTNASCTGAQGKLSSLPACSRRAARAESGFTRVVRST